MMELVVYASERIMGLKECPAQAANKSFLQLKYQGSMQGLVFILIFRPLTVGTPVTRRPRTDPVRFSRIRFLACNRFRLRHMH